METTLQIFHNSSLLKFILHIGDAKLTVWWSCFKFPSYRTSLTWPVGLTPLWIYRIFSSWKRRFRFFIVHRSLFLFYPMHHRCEAELSGGLTPIFQMYKYLVKIFIRLHFFQISLISAFLETYCIGIQNLSVKFVSKFYSIGITFHNYCLLCKALRRKHSLRLRVPLGWRSFGIL